MSTTRPPGGARSTPCTTTGAGRENSRELLFRDRRDRARPEHLPEDIAPAVEFAYLTGWRIGEIRSLKWSQIDGDTYVIRLEPGTTKNDEGRTFPFGEFPRLAALLTRQLDRTDALQRKRGKIVPWVFWRDGEQLQ